MTEKYDIEIKIGNEVLSGCPHVVQKTLSGCPHVVQKTYSLVWSGPVRDSKQRNKRVMIVFNGNIGTMQENTKQRKTQIHRH